MSAASICKTLIPGGTVCGDPADHVIAAGCVHEHVNVEPICEQHYRLLGSKKIACRICRESQLPHLCALHWRPAPREQVAS